MSKEFLRDNDNNLTGIITVNVDENLQEIPNTEKTWKADLVLWEDYLLLGNVLDLIQAEIAIPEPIIISDDEHPPVSAATLEAPSEEESC